jgi:hypothetical protein
MSDDSIIPSFNIPFTNLHTPTERELLTAAASTLTSAWVAKKAVKEQVAETVEDWSTTVPEGYLLPRRSVRGVPAAAYGVDSAVLAASGVLWDDTVRDGLSLDMRGDARLERIKVYARELRASDRFAEMSPNQRERAITDLLMVMVNDEYGSYSMETLAAKSNKAERDARGMLWNSKAQLKDMPKGSIVCRHYAPLMSVALNEAGVHNTMVISRVNFDVMSDDGRLTLDEARKPGYHAYVVTDNAAIVEATRAGQATSAYDPIVNGVTARNIVFHGMPALTAGYLMYGGHTGDGDGSPARALQAQKAGLERYNDQQAAERAERQNAARRHAALAELARQYGQLANADGGRLSDEQAKRLAARFALGKSEHDIHNEAAAVRQEVGHYWEEHKNAGEHRDKRYYGDLPRPDQVVGHANGIVTGERLSQAVMLAEEQYGKPSTAHVASYGGPAARPGAPSKRVQRIVG